MPSPRSLLPLLLALYALPAAWGQGGETFSYAYPAGFSCPQVRRRRRTAAATGVACLRCAPLPCEADGPAASRPACLASPPPPQLTLSAIGGAALAREGVPKVLETLELQPAPTMHFISAGRYLIDRNLTLSKPVVMEAGAVLEVAAGVRLVLQQPLTAPPRQVFDGEGRVTVGGAVSVMAEWWGERGAGGKRRRGGDAARRGRRRLAPPSWPDHAA